MSAILVRDRRTGEEFTAYRDPEGLWIEDPAGPGYAWDESNYEEVR